MYNIKKITVAVAVASLPLVSHAETITTFKGLISYIQSTINSIIPLLLGVAVIVFMWGVIKYIIASGPESVAAARNYIVMGIVAITVMLSVWGLAFLVKNIFFQGVSTPIDFTQRQPDPLSGE